MEYALEAIGRAVCQSAGYEFGAPAGRGSFKETFSAKDKSGRAVAVKVLRPGCATERNCREIEAMKRCSHPNVAALLELSTIEVDGAKYDYLIEPFMAGGTLDDRIKKALLNRDEVLALGSALIDAVNHIANQNLVHRDIKPANIMFADNHGPPVVGDFGIVRDLGKESLTPSFAVSGPCTPYFAAPEQLNNEKFIIDWRADQFAIATTLSFAHFGFHPYRAHGESDDQSVRRVIAKSGPSGDFVRLTTDAGLPALAIMLAAWPASRYRTPEALAVAWTNQRTS